MSDDYVVKLPNGDVRVMTIDELDDAFERREINERTPVLAPHGSSWTTIAKLGGFETDELASLSEPEPAGHHPTSLSPMSFSPHAPPPATPWPSAVADPDEVTFHIPRRSKTPLFVGLAVAVLAGVGGGAVIVGSQLAKLRQAAPVVAVEAPPPVVVAPAPLPAPVVETPPSPATNAEPSSPAVSVSALPPAGAPRGKKPATKRAR